MLVTLFLTLSLLPGILAQNPSFKNPPSDTTGVKDHDVTMYCQVGDKGKSNLYWHCNSNNGNQDVTVGPNENTNPALSKYLIDNSGASIGQYNLIVTNVTMLDSGMCTCIVDAGSGNAMEAGAMLDVMETPAAPMEPKCTADKDRTPGRTRRTFTADDTIQLTCESQGGVPLADIHWEVVRASNNGKGVRILSSYITTSTSITAVANYNITSYDDGAYFQCVQTHVELSSPSDCNPIYTNAAGQNFQIGSPTRLIKAEYPPILRFVPSELKVTPLETTREILRCEAQANPGVDSGPSIRHRPANADESLTLNYTVPGQEDSVNLTLTQDDNGKVLECVATNEVGQSVLTIKIGSTGLLPTWILLIIIGGGGLILFFIIAVICCICFCGSDDDKDHHSVNRSRPGTFQGSELGVDDYPYGGESDMGYTDGFDHDPEMVNINEFDGGMEMKGDYETGEENQGYLVDDDLDDDDIPPAPPLDMKSTPSSRTYDQVPLD